MVAVNRAALRGVFQVSSLGHLLPRHWPETPEKNLPNGVLSWCTAHPNMCLDTWTCGLLLATAWLSQKASDLALSLWMAACAQLTLGILLSSMAWGPQASSACLCAFFISQWASCSLLAPAKSLALQSHGRTLGTAS